jgi:hypothetical protein
MMLVDCERHCCDFWVSLLAILQTRGWSQATMGFKESRLKGKIAGLKHNIAITEKLSPNSKRLEELKKELADTEAQLKQLQNSN